MNSSENSSTSVWITGKSRICTASTSRRPRPGQLNTASTRIEPPSRKPNCRPIIVTTGISALRSVCLNTTLDSRTPLARAGRTKSSWITSTNEARGERAPTGATAAPPGVAGGGGGEGGNQGRSGRAQRDRGQDVVLPGRGAHRGQPAELHREDLHQQHAQCKCRKGDAR